MAGGLHPIFIVEEAVKAIGLVDAHGHCLIPGMSSTLGLSWQCSSLLQ